MSNGTSEDIVRTVKKLLELLSEQYPSRNQRHNVTLAENGVLEVTLFLGETWQAFWIEEGDLDDSAEIACANIVKEMDTMYQDGWVR
jgi:hypothetical protein